MPKSKNKRKNGKKGGSSKAKYMNAPKFKKESNIAELHNVLADRLFGERY